MGGRDDLKTARVAASGRWPPVTGGETRGISRRASRTSSKVRRSVCREFVANVAEVLGRAVRPLARAWSCRVSGAEKTSSRARARSMQRSERQWRRSPSRPIFVAGVGRLSRLCVLMNPILPGAIPRDLAGEILIIVLLPVQALRLGQELNLTISAADPARIATRQFTNRRMRTFMATPRARNVNNTEDPP